MAAPRILTLSFLVICVMSPVLGHKKQRRGFAENFVTSNNHRDLRNSDNLCPPPLSLIKVQSQSENIAGLTGQGGLTNLYYMCGTTQVPYQAPVRWVMREEPNGGKVNVTIYETRYKMVPLCCPGYTRNEVDICVPKCKGNCTNGLCVSPNRCVCYDGYTLNSLGDCVVTCPCGCPNGNCRGNTCVCNPGYSLDPSGVCNPACVNECVNGECTSPNQCTCNDGYRRQKYQDSHMCFPHCTIPCDNGKCLAPDICECNSGYERERNTGRCIPKCNGCEHGDCVAPYTCHCHEGYRRENETCSPICTGECFNSTCTAPNECTCFKGYEHTHPQVCVPRCRPACQNAYCVAPNTCKCYPGFRKKFISTYYKCESIAANLVNAIIRN